MASKSKLPTRPFIYTDDTAIQICRTALDLLPDDLQLFKDFDPTIDAQFLTDWEAAIEASIHYTTDQSFEAELLELSTARNQAMRAGIKSYNWLMHFVRKAYEDNEGMLTEFGNGQLAKVRYSPGALYNFLVQMHGTATDNIDALTATDIGYKTTFLDKLLADAEDLKAKQTAFLNKKREQKTVTTERITRLRAMWKYQTEVNKVAKIIFEDNYAKYHQYLLPKKRGGERKEKEGE